MAEQTPLMIQYQSIKENYPNEVLFFRLGDFYEMFNDDAVEVSRLLNLTLTHRGPSPMCGIPYHAYKGYLDKLIERGYKVAFATDNLGDVKDCDVLVVTNPSRINRNETEYYKIVNDFKEKGIEIEFAVDNENLIENLELAKEFLSKH